MIRFERGMDVGRSRCLLSRSARSALLAALAGAWATAGAQGVGPAAAEAASAPSRVASGVAQLDAVTVTASRRRERAVDVPASLSVVDPNALISKGITDINGVADLIPNLRSSSGGSPGLGNLTLRGVFSGSAPTTGIYVDDVPYGPVLGGAGSDLALDATLFDIRRIEVSRGPQGTLFGAGSMGGVVRYITDEPSLSSISGHAFADLSQTKRGGTNTLLRGKISLPVLEDKLGVSVSVFDSRPSGYVDEPARNASKVNDSTLRGGLASILFEPFNSTTVRLNAMHQEIKYDSGGTEAFNPKTGQLLLGPYADTQLMPTPRKLNFDLEWLTIEHDLGFARFASVTSYQRLKFDNQIDLTSTFGPVADSIAPAGAPHQVGFDSAFKTKRFTQEFRLTSPKTGKLEWLVGAYYTNQRTSDSQDLLPSPADINLLTSDSPLKYKEYAGFGNVTYYITPQWDVTAGIRQAHNENTQGSNASGIFVTPLTENTISDNVTTYLANTRYRVSDSLNLYARAASGYRPAGANLVTLDTSGNPVGQTGYKSDSLWSYEIGAKGILLDRRLTYDVAVYYLDWKNTQIGVTFPSGLGGLGNAHGGVKGDGLEASLTAEVVKNFFLTASLGVANTKLKQDEPDLGALSGERLPGIPRQTAALLADYRIPVADRLTATFGGTWRYTGSYNSSFNGGTGSDGTAITPPQTNYTNASFSQFDLRAGLQYGAVSANLYATNITNRHAYQSVQSVSPTYAQGIVLRPRTIGVNVRYDF